MQIHAELLKANLKRTFSGPRGWLLFGYGLGISLVQYLTLSPGNYLNQPSAIVRLIGIDFTGFGTELFLFSLPFVLAFYGVNTFANDRNWHMMPSLFSRMGRRAYYQTQCLQVALSGGLAGTLPYLIHMIIFAMCFPWQRPDILQRSLSIFYDPYGLHYLLHTHPLLLIFLMLGFQFLVCALLSWLSLTISYRLKAKYTELLIPFLIFFCSLMLPVLIENDFVSFNTFLQLRRFITANLKDMMLVGGELLLMALFAWVLLKIQIRRGDGDV